MDDKEKRQKTVVAFVAGLLIGGLLVWVFTMAPEEEKKVETKKTPDTKETVVDTSKNVPRVEDEATPEPAMTSTEDGALRVENQGAGTRVALASFDMPVDAGWVVVHEVRADGTLGNALGAARFSQAEKLTPTAVELLRTTVSGKTYHAVVYADNGNKVFDLKQDMVVMMGGNRLEDSFTAQ